MKFEFLEHTADLKIRVYGRNLKDIIENSLLALKEFLEPELTHQKIFFSLEIKSENLVNLLIDFLNEVLAQTYINKAIFLNFSEEILEEKYLKGKLEGFKFLKINKDIKAITYHQAKIEKFKENLIFEFIIDI